MLTDDRIVQAGAIAAKALASTVTEEQRSDYFTVLAATAPAPPGAEQCRMQRVCTLTVACRPLNCPCGTCSVCSVIGPVFSEYSGETGSEEVL